MSIFKAILDFIMTHLELFVLCAILQFWFNAGSSWKYWVTVFLVGMATGISNKWKNVE